MMGLNLGILFGVGVYITIMKNALFSVTFTIAGIFQGFFALMTPFMVIEPPDLKKKQMKQK